MQVILPCRYHCWWIQMNPPKIYREILWYLPLQIRLWVHPKCSYCTYSYILVNTHHGSDIHHGVQWIPVDGKQHRSHFNQAKTLHHFFTKVQDNTMSGYPLSIITADRKFCMELAMAGIIECVDTLWTTDKYFNSWRYITLSSPCP